MQNRYNPFTQIHKGLQAMLYHTAMAIQHNDFTSETENAALVAEVKKVLWLFDGHAHTEDSMVFPLIAAHAPEVVADFEAQHETDHQLGADVQAAVDTLEKCSNEAEAVAAGASLKRAFERFIAFNLEHMIMEETAVAPIIWQHYSDEELHALTERIVAHLPADKNALYTDWMLLGNSNAEVIQWLSAVRAHAPSFVFEGICSQAKNILPAVRWQKIETAIQEQLIALN